MLRKSAPARPGWRARTSCASTTLREWFDVSSIGGFCRPRNKRHKVELRRLTAVTEHSLLLLLVDRCVCKLR